MTTMRIAPTLWALFLVLALTMAPVRALAQSSPVKLGAPAPRPANLDFEEGEAGKAPPGWTATTAASGCPVVGTEENPRSGKRAAVLRPDKPTSQVGILMQSVDATAPVQTVVFTVVDSRLRRQVVSLGASDTRNIEVLQGLAEGVDLVLNPRADLIDGELVTAT